MKSMLKELRQLRLLLWPFAVDVKSTVVHLRTILWCYAHSIVRLPWRYGINVKSTVFHLRRLLWRSGVSLERTVVHLNRLLPCYVVDPEEL